MRRRTVLTLIALTGCAGDGFTAPDPVRLPRDAVEGAGDPSNAAISRAAFSFSHPASLVGRPGDAARAIADMEFLAAALPFDPRFQQRDPLLPDHLAQARAEWRPVLGIAPTQPAQPVIDALYAVWRTMLAQDPASAAAALPPGLFAPDVLSRLGALPTLPRTAFAASSAARVRSTRDTSTGRRFR